MIMSILYGHLVISGSLSLCYLRQDNTPHLQIRAPFYKIRSINLIFQISESYCHKVYAYLFGV